MADDSARDPTGSATHARTRAFYARYLVYINTLLIQYRAKPGSGREQGLNLVPQMKQESRAVQGAVSYTHLTLPTNSLV